jgi:Ca-activated chloride channel family protein
MDVANILPGDRVDVELRYSELLVPEAGVYELVYPTVVGPRYCSKPKSELPPHSGFVRSPYLHDRAQPPYGFHLEGTVAAGVPLIAPESPSHRVRAAAAGGATRITLDPGERAGGDRDFILRYRLAGEQIASGLQLYRGADEGFFLLMVQPPARPRPEQIPPREYVFIVDVSGSMHGFPLAVAQRLLADLIGSLRPTDRFNVLLFSGDSRQMAPASVTATPGHVREALALLDGLDAGGGTELLPAVQRAMALPRADERVARSFVVITDGYIAEEEGVFHYIRDHLGQANVFAFGIGTAVNRHLIEGVAHAGLGEPFVVTNAGEAEGAARRFADYVRAPVLTHVRVAFDGFDAYDVEPKVMPTLFAERPLLVHGKWRGRPAGTITVTGAHGEGTFRQAVAVSPVIPSADNQALTWLWARARIDDLVRLTDADRRDSQKDAITQLGLKYHLLTEYTSFIAVDHTPRVASASPRQVMQPLPLPAAVEDSAIAQGPEPSLWLLALALGGILLVARARSRARAGGRA